MLLAFGLFGFAFAIHWLIWRVCLPRRQTAALLAIFMGIWLLAIVVAFLWPTHPVGWWQGVQVSLFHIATALAYIVAYSAIEERSPSMTLVTFVADAREVGRTREEMLVVLQGFEPLSRRLAAMVRDGMIAEDADRYVLTAKGRQWVWVLSNWRRLMGRGKGG